MPDKRAEAPSFAKSGKLLNITDEYNFAWQFRTLESIEWLMDCEYILDYNDFKDYSLWELEEIQETYFEAWREMVAYPAIQEEDDYEALIEFCNLSENMYSLQILYEYKVSPPTKKRISGL